MCEKQTSVQVFKHMACAGKIRTRLQLGLSPSEKQREALGQRKDGTGRLSSDNEEFTVKAKVLLSGCAKFCSFSVAVN